MEHPRGTFQFGRFKLEPSDRRLTSDGEEIYLRPKTYDTLLYLVERPGHLVTKNDLLDAVWEGVEVSENALTRCIKEVRAALGDEVENPHFIRTVPRLGYEFIAGVDLLADHESRDRAVRKPEAPQVPSRLRLPGNLRRAIFWLAAAAFVLVAASFALNLGGLRNRLLPSVGASHGAPFPKIRSIAVLPLENLSGDPQQEYFADGMTEELITDLGKISALRIISRTSVMRYKDTKKPLPEIARELHVDAIVEGAVLRSGGRVRITANLLYAPTDRHLWAETYERDLGDVLVLQSEVARAIASQIRIKLTPQEHVRLASSRPLNAEAYRLYLEGRYYFFKGGPPGIEKSIQLFKQALEKDPNSALAYAGLSESYGELAGGDLLSLKAAIAKARAAALKALELDSSLAEAHAALADVLFYYDWDWPAAERELKRAIELKPNDAVAHHRYAWYLRAMGRHEQAFAEMRHAEDLDPVSPHLRVQASRLYYFADRYDEAIEEARKGVELDPNYGLAHSDLAYGYLGKEMPEKAMPEFEEWARLSGYEGTRLANILSLQRAWAYTMAGKRAEALKMLHRLKKQFDKEALPPVHFIALCAALGEKQTALELLEKCYEERDPAMTLLNVKTWWDPIRSEPRFQSILRRMNFPP